MSYIVLMTPSELACPNTSAKSFGFNIVAIYDGFNREKKGTQVYCYEKYLFLYFTARRPFFNVLVMWFTNSDIPISPKLKSDSSAIFVKKIAPHLRVKKQIAAHASRRQEGQKWREDFSFLNS